MTGLIGTLSDDVCTMWNLEINVITAGSATKNCRNTCAGEKSVLGKKQMPSGLNELDGIIRYYLDVHFPDTL